MCQISFRPYWLARRETPPSLRSKTLPTHLGPSTATETIRPSTCSSNRAKLLSRQRIFPQPKSFLLQRSKQEISHRKKAQRTLTSSVDKLLLHTKQSNPTRSRRSRKHSLS